MTMVNMGPVRRIRVAPNSHRPLVTRVVFDLSRPSQYRVEQSGDRAYDLTVVFPLASDVATPDPVAALIEETATPARSTPVLPVMEAGPLVDESAAMSATPVVEEDVLSADAAPMRAMPVEVDDPEPSAPAPLSASPLVTVGPPVSPPSPSMEAIDVGQVRLADLPRAVPDRTTMAEPEPESEPEPEAQREREPEPESASERPTPSADEREVTPSSQPTQSPVTGGQSTQFTGDPVSLDFQNADLRAVLRTFAEISSLNIVIDPSVQGSVDVALRDVPWDQAFDIILRANTLGYLVDGTIVRVAPLSVLADEEAQRRKLAEEQALSGELLVVPLTLSYARATDMVDLLTRSVLSSRGQVQVDDRTNTLIISDLAERIDTATELIETLDRPEPQVEIEARIVQANHNFARAIGVQWGLNGRVAPELANTTPLSFPNRGNLTGRVPSEAGGTIRQGPFGIDARAIDNENTGTAVNLPASTINSALGLTLGAVNGALNLDVVLSAAESEGSAQLISNPRVTTQNNVQAEIVQGARIPFQTVANNTVTTTFIDAALALRVTPQITDADTVIMQIELTNDQPGEERPGGTTINTQRASMTLQVADGETTVIGGIFESTQRRANERTPVLYRIPLLGWLFRNTLQDDLSRELLIFLTPRIIR